METSKVTTKGQIVIPHRIRKKHGIKSGTKFAFIENGEDIIIRAMDKNYFKKLIGIAGTKGKALKSLIEDKKKEKEL